MSDEIQMLPVPEGCEELVQFCDRFIREIAETLGITYEQLVHDSRDMLIKDGLI